MEEEGRGKDFFSSWTEFQRSFYTQWADAYRKIGWPWMDPTKFWEGTKGPFPYADLFSKWSQMVQDTLGKAAEQTEGGVGPAVFFRILRASNVFVVLNEFWMEVLKDLPGLYQAKGDPVKSREIFDRWAERYQKVFHQIVGSPVTDTGQEIMKSWLNIVQMYQGAMGLVWTPWTRAIPQFQAQAEKFMKGDWAALSEARSLWREVYDETLGRVFGMPAFGLTKEQTERVRKTYDALIQFWSSLPHFYRYFYQTGMDALKKVFEKLQDLKFEEITPEKAREVYQVWWTTNENAFFELFKKPDFGKAMNEVLNYGLRLKKRLDDLTAEWCKNLSIPSYRDFDEIALALQELRREVRRQRKTIEELQRKMSPSG
jgi:class III poly(R)-hydroxyalkanoic acid synthase PhaE subunit